MAENALTLDLVLASRLSSLYRLLSALNRLLLLPLSRRKLLLLLLLLLLPDGELQKVDGSGWRGVDGDRAAPLHRSGDHPGETKGLRLLLLLLLLDPLLLVPLELVLEDRLRAQEEVVWNREGSRICLRNP